MNNDNNKAAMNYAVKPAIHALGKTVQPLRLMVVDDNVDAAESLSMLLSMHGHHLETAYDGVEAIHLAVGFKPQVIFLDIGMPDMNGYEVAEALRKMPELKDTTLIALTGWDAESDRIKSTETVFNYHFTKPVKIDQLNEVLAVISEAHES